MKNILQGTIIGIFVLVLLGGIYFAMSVDGPGLPPSHAPQYMIKDDGRSVSCFFPLLGGCEKPLEDTQTPPLQ